MEIQVKKLFLIICSLMPCYLAPNICANTYSLENNLPTLSSGFNPLSLCQIVSDPNSSVTKCCGDKGNFDAIDPGNNYNNLVGIWQIAMGQYTGTEPNTIPHTPSANSGLPHCVVNNGACLGVPSKYSNLSPIGQVQMPTNYSLQICNQNDLNTLSVNGSYGSYLQCLNDCNKKQCPGYGSKYQYSSCSNNVCNYNRPTPPGRNICYSSKVGTFLTGFFSFTGTCTSAKCSYSWASGVWTGTATCPNTKGTHNYVTSIKGINACYSSSPGDIINNNGKLNCWCSTSGRAIGVNNIYGYTASTSQCAGTAHHAKNISK